MTPPRLCRVAEKIGHRLRPQLQAFQLALELVQSWDRIDTETGDG
jgi:hypothetical protein